MFDPYLALLSLPGLRRLLGGALIGRLPQGMSGLAILLLVRDATGSYAASGAAVGAYALASAIAAPVQGRLVDRFGRLRVLLPSALGQGVVLVALVLSADGHAGSVALVLLSGLAGALVPPIAPAMRALLSEVIEDPGIRETGYALEAVAQELVWISGPLVVSLVITATSAQSAVLLLAVICIAGTFLFVRSPLAHDHRSSVPRTRSVANATSGVRALLGPIALMGVGIGAIEVGLPSLALHAGSRSASGVLLALWSVGSMIGGLWYGLRVWSSSLVARYRALLVLNVVFTAPLIFAHSVAVAAACSLLAGLALAPLFSCQYALVGRDVTPGSETEAFTWMTAALVAGIAGGAALGGAVIGSMGVSAPFELACAATTLAAILAIGLRGRSMQPV